MSTQSNQKIKTFIEDNRVSFIRRYLMVINCVLPEDRLLNMNEINLLSVLLSLTDNVHKYNRFNSTARKIARDKLKFSLSTVTNTIATLKDKRAVYEDANDGVLKIAKALIIEEDSAVITAVIRLEEPSIVFSEIDNSNQESIILEADEV